MRRLQGASSGAIVGGMAGVTTLEEAYEYVQEVKLCTIYSRSVKGTPSLWEAVDLPDTGGATKWGARMEAVWTWKNELPAVYPDDIFYGKIAGGHAVLMAMDHLRAEHYPRFHKPVAQCGALARDVFEIIRLSPGETAQIRQEAMERSGCTQSRFETALKQLQVTLNIARSNEPDVKKDLWLPFLELYPEFEEYEKLLL